MSDERTSERLGELTYQGVCPECAQARRVTIEKPDLEAWFIRCTVCGATGTPEEFRLT